MLEALSRQFKSGPGWFLLASALTAFGGVASGPFVLKKVGLEGFALLGLATYFFNIIVGYSDFSSPTHLLIVFSKKAPDRKRDFGNAAALKVFLIILFFAILAVWSQLHPRPDGLYPLLAVFMLTVFFSPGNLEWYFIAKQQYFRIFLSRALTVSLQLLLLVLWLLMDWQSILIFPCILLMSATAGSLVLLGSLGWKSLQEGVRGLKLASSRGVWKLLIRLSPMSASLLVMPYFLAYALPWYSMTHPGKIWVGSFAIAYRLIMGMIALIVPLVVHTLSRSADSSSPVSFFRTLRFSVMATGGFWILGLPVLWLYFRISNLDPALFSHCLSTFSILLLGVFFMCLRTPYIGRWLLHGSYLRYFLVLLFSCTPVLLLSWILKERFPSSWVAWCACIPDFLTTLFFVSRTQFRASKNPG